MIRTSRATAATVVTLLVAAGGLALSAPAALAAPPPGGNDGPQCVNALIAAQNSNGTALGDDAAGNAAGAANQDAATGSDLFTAELNCYYTPSYTAYQDTIQATTDNGSAQSANQGGNTSAGTSYEQAAGSLISTAMNIEMGYGYL
jgi:hypothetical protein